MIKKWREQKSVYFLQQTIVKYYNIYILIQQKMVYITYYTVCRYINVICM